MEEVYYNTAENPFRKPMAWLACELLEASGVLS